MTATECADTCKAAAPGGACRDGIRQHAGARSRVAPRLCNSATCYIGSLPSVEAGRLCRAITISAIPLKTAFAAERLRLPTILDLATAMGRCVTIKREAHICLSSPHEAGGGTRCMVPALGRFQ